MTFGIEQERFSPFAGQTIDVCPGCGGDIVSADGMCIRLTLGPGAPSRLHDQCFVQILFFLRVFEAFAMATTSAEALN